MKLIFSPEVRRWSRENLPAPKTRMDINPRNIHKSTLDSCIACQKPLLISMGIFVVIIATDMFINKGIADNLVSKPIINIKPKTISTTPTKGAKNPG